VTFVTGNIFTQSNYYLTFSASCEDIKIGELNKLTDKNFS